MPTQLSLSQVKDAIQTELSDNPGGRPRRTQRAAVGRGGGSAAATSKYSRLEAEVAAMQRDSGTYCDDPPDSDAYEAWFKVRPVSRNMCRRLPYHVNPQWKVPAQTSAASNALT